ncbi:hypothetical protein [Salinimonas chungwhensis]|uniref:hypothetical protein n=1 Tax=Salinimonas chungwhensis TaxID=265425 RepID=UPI00036E7E66|nr:hypothetical protein [Salinimonas chungwhensis]
MNLNKDFITLQITGHNVEKGYIYGILKDGSDAKLTLVQNKNSTAQNFVSALSDSSAKTYAPVGAHIVAYGINTINADSGFISANFASAVTKNPEQKHTFVTPIKVDRKPVARGNGNNRFLTLGASVLDADYTRLQNIKGLRKELTDVLRGSSNKSVPGYSRGFMVRVGHTQPNGQKAVVPYEFYAYPNEKASDAIQRLYDENGGDNKFRRMLARLNREIGKDNAVIEAAGISRVSFNDYGNPNNLSKYANAQHYKAKIQGQVRQAYSMAAISINKQINRIDSAHPLPRAKIQNSVSGLLGIHNDIDAPSFNSDTPGTANKSLSAGIKGYPLRIEQQLDSSGRLSRFAVTGPRTELDNYKSRIESAAVGVKPFYKEDTNSYIFPAIAYKEVASTLSDLSGTPAIYISEQKKTGKASYIYINGRTDEQPFRKRISNVAKNLSGENVGGAWRFPEKNRLQVEEQLGDLLSQSARPETAIEKKFKPRFPDYAEWQQQKYSLSGNSMKDAHYDQIEKYAEEAGIDWAKTAPNILMPSPDTGTEMFLSNASQKDVFPKQTAHNGSCSVIASTYRYKSKKTDKEHLGIYLQFKNLKMGGGEFFTEFKSGDYDFSLYESERGTGKVKTGGSSPEEIAKREADNQQRLAEKAKREAEQTKKSLQDALMTWGQGIQATGNEPYNVKKGLQSHIELIDLRTAKTPSGSTFSMYQLVDEYGNFTGLQKIYDKGWKDEKGRTTNKVFTEGTVFNDLDTGNPVGTHGRVGIDDGIRPIVYAEGMADTLSAVAATGHFGKIGINKNNLKSVVAVSVHNNPNRDHIVVGDNDRAHKDGNIGAKAALDAAWQNNVKWMIPNFEGMDLSSDPKDINDLHHLAGLEEVQRQIGAAYPAPQNLLEYYNTRLRFENDKTYPAAFEKALKEITERYPQMDKSRIEAGLTFKRTEQNKYQSQVNDSQTKSERSEKSESESTESTETDDVVSEFTAQFPVVIEEKVAPQSQKKYLVIRDHSNGVYADPIATAIEECMPGKQAMYHPGLKSYVAPASLKNVLNSKLHEATGAPANYIGKRLNTEGPGFVVRGELTQEVIDDLESTIGFINGYFDNAEQGFVVENDLAIYLVQEALGNRLTGSHTPASFTASATEFKPQTLVDGSLENRAKELGLKPSDIAKMQAFLIVKEKGLPQDGYWFAGLCAKIKQSEQANGQKASYSSLLHKAYHQASSLFASDTYSDEQFIAAAPVWYFLGDKYDWTGVQEDEASENTDKQEQDVLPAEPVQKPEIESTPENVSTETVSTERTSNNAAPGVESEKPENTVEPIEESQSIEATTNANSKSNVTSSEVSPQSDLFGFISEQEEKNVSNAVEATIPSVENSNSVKREPVEQPLESQDAIKQGDSEKSTIGKQEDTSEHDTTEALEDVQEASSQEVNEQAISEIELRIRKLNDTITLLVENGYSHDEFLDLVSDSPDCIGYEKEDGSFDKTLLQADFRQISLHPIPDLATFKPTSLSAAYYHTYNIVSDNRINELKAFISELMETKGALSEKSFTKYIKGKTSSKGFQSTQPYLSDGEFNEELMNEDILHVTEYKHVNELYRDMRELFKRDLANEEVDSQESEPSVTITLEGQKQSATRLHDSGKASLFQTDETGEYIIQTGDKIELATIENIKNAGSESEPLMLDKIQGEGRGMYVVTKPDTNRVFYTSFGDATALYRRLEASIVDTDDSDVSSSVQPTATQIQQTLSAYFSDQISIDEIVKRVEQKFNVIVDEPTKNIISSAFDKHSESFSDKPVSQSEKLSALQNEMATRAKTEMLFHEFYEDHFKPEGFAYEENPFFSNETGSIDRKSLNASLKDAGFNSLKQMYQDIFDSVVEITHDHYTATKVGGFIPNAGFKKDIDLEVQFENLLKVVRRAEPTTADSQLLPFTDYLGSTNAYQPINQIQGEPLDAIAEPGTTDKYSLDEYLLLADLHHVADVSASNSKVEIAEKIKATWKVRKELTFMSETEIAALDIPTLQEYAEILNVSTTSHNKMYARKIVEKLVELKDATHTKVAQYNYIADAVSSLDKNVALPGYVYRDLSNITDSTVLNISQVTQYKRKQFDNAKIRTELADSLKSINLLSPETRGVLSNVDLSDAYVVGIEEAKYASKAYTYSIPKGTHIDKVQLPLDVSYHTVINDQLLGLNKPLDQFWIAQHGYSPVSPKAMKALSIPVEKFVESTGYLGFRDAKGNSALIRPAKRGFSAIEYDEATGEVNTRRFQYTSEFVELYRAKGYEFSDLDPILDELALDESADKVEQLAFIRNLQDGGLTNDQTDQLASLLTDEIEATAIQKAVVALSRIEASLKQSITEKLTHVAQSIPININANYPSTITALKEAKQMQAEPVMAETNPIAEQAIVETPEPQATVSGGLFDMLDSDAPIDKISEEAEIAAVNEIGEGKLVVHSSGRVGVVSNVDGEQVTVKPDWEYRILQSASARDSLIDKESGRYIFTLEMSEFAKTKDALALDIDIDLLDPRDANGIARIESMPLLHLKEFNSILANDTSSNDRSVLAGNAVSKVQARTAGRLFATGDSELVQENELAALKHFASPDDPSEVIQWYGEELKKTKANVLSRNFEKALSKAVEFGFEPGMDSTHLTVSAADLDIVNEATLLKLASTSTLSEILNQQSPESRYIATRHVRFDELESSEKDVILHGDVRINFIGDKVSYSTSDGSTYPSLNMLLDHHATQETEPVFHAGQELVLIDGENVTIEVVAEDTYPEDGTVMLGEESPTAHRIESVFEYDFREVEARSRQFFDNANGTIKQLLNQPFKNDNNDANIKDFAYNKMAETSVRSMLEEIEANGQHEFMGYELYIAENKYSYIDETQKTDPFETIANAQEAVQTLVNQAREEEQNADAERHRDIHDDVLSGSAEPIASDRQMGGMAEEQNATIAATANQEDRGSRVDDSASTGDRLSRAGSVPSVHKGPSNAGSAQRAPTSERTVTYSYPDNLEDNIGTLPKKIELNIEALRISKLIDEEQREATLEEKDALAHYTGWGGMPGMFDHTNYLYSQQRRQLTELVSAQEYSSIKESALTAFYTPPSIIKEVYFGASKFGFVGGEVSDPSTGIGSFLSTMPEELKENSNVTARELDTVTARIAQQIHGEKIVKQGGFEKTKQPNNYFDLITSNIPFGNYSVFDPDYAQYGYKIHDYFLVKNIDKVKPGGIVAFITSTGTMDKADDAARQHVYKSSDLVASVRLPSKTFSKYANTHVGADVVFFRKRLPGEEPLSSDWLNTETIDAEDRNGDIHTHSINGYYVKNPQMIIGNTVSVRGQYGYELSSLYDGNVAEALHSALEGAPSPKPTRKKDASIVIEETKSEETITLIDDHLRPGSFTMAGDQLGVAVSTYNPETEDYDLTFEPINVKGKKAERLSSLIGIRDHLRAHISLQMQTTGMPEELAESITRLNTLYDQHVKKFENLSESTTKQAFQEDPDYPLLMGLEIVDKSTQKIVKTNVFSERTIGKNSRPTHADSADEAFAISMAWDGTITPSFVSELLGKNWEQITEENVGTLFVDPSQNKWVHRSQYLSGNILEKLESAKAAVELDSSFQQNVEALEEAMPEPVLAEEIKLRLGSGWVPTEIISRFTEMVITGESSPFPGEANPNFKVSLIGADWQVGVSDWTISQNDGRARNRYGTERISASELIQKVLNGSKIEICDTVEDKRVVNIDQTAIANSKAQDIKELFNSWVWNDPERKALLTQVYNNRFNVFVEAKYDGSGIQFTGLSPTFNGKPFTPRQTQRNTIMRYFQEGRALLAHGVGTGKSFELASIAIEGKARNLHQKPVVAVPNNVFGQLSRSIQQHYPNARILSLDPKKMNKTQRHELTSKIATGNWDCVVVAHSTLDKLSAPKQFVDNQLQKQIWELQSVIDNQDSQGTFTNKRAQQKLKNLETKLQKRLDQDSKDNVLYLDQLGIDALLVDEADNFLNLGSPSNMAHVNGVNTQESKRAMNMLFMTRFIQDMNNNRGVVWATGTDIRKSMSDLYVNLYVLAPDELKKLGVDNFDAFMSVFGEVVTTIEANPEGTGYRENSRLAKFNNLPELGQLYRTVADVVTAEMAGVEKPESTKIGVKCQGNEFFSAYMKDIGKRATSFRQGSKEETWFAIQHSSQLAAMDMRCVDPTIPEAPGCKISKAAQNILAEHKPESETPRAQLVFIDRFVNPTAAGFSVYDTLIDKLVDGGIPRDKIIDSRQVVSESQKKDFEDGMNSGKYLVAIGTTERFGVGNNIQTNLVAMHELTPPWNPRDLEQRLGRIERHGNLNDEVNVYRYTTENSFDLFQWETMKRKASFIMQTKLEPHLAPREYTEEADATYSEMMAIATGNTLIKDKIEVDADLQRLERLKRSHIDGKRQMQGSITYSERFIVTQHKHLEFIQTFIDKLPDNSSFEFEGKSFGQDLKGGAEAIKSVFKKMEGNKSPQLIVNAGKFGDLELKFRLEERSDGKKGYTLKAYVGKETVKVSNNAYVGAQLSDLPTLLPRLLEEKESCLAQISKEENRIESLKQELHQPFEKESELLTLTNRAEQLNKQLLQAANEASNNDDDVDWETLLGEHNQSEHNLTNQPSMGM